MKVIPLFLLSLFPASIVLNGQVSSGKIKKLVIKDDTAAISRLLANGLDINATYKRHSTLLLFAAEYGKYDLVKLLVNKGVDMNIADKDKYTPLLISTSFTWRNDSISAYLISHGANPDIIGMHGSNALRNSIGIFGEGQSDSIFKLLIAKGANINYVCAECCNRSTFLYCCAWGKPDMIQLLIDKKSNINQEDCEGLNGLMYAIRTNNADAVKILLQNGIDLNHTDQNGKTAMDYAVDKKNNAIIQLLKAK